MSESGRVRRLLQDSCSRTVFVTVRQGHVFQWYDEGKITDEEATALLAQLAPMDLDRIALLFRETMAAKIAGISEEAIKPVSKTDNLGSIAKDVVDGWNAQGLAAIARGEVQTLPRPIDKF